VTSPTDTSQANTADTNVIDVSATIKKRRLSTMSANAPAGSANRNIGSVCRDLD